MNLRKFHKDEKGSFMVLALMVLMMVSFVGMYAMRNSRIELQTASNDIRYKTAFLSADGALDLATELLEQNMATQTGFTETTAGANVNIGTGVNQIEVENTSLNLWTNPTPTCPSDTNWDFRLPVNGTGNHVTNITVGLQDRRRVVGAALQQVAGYEGKAKGMSQGGGIRIYKIFSQHIYNQNSNLAANSTVGAVYRHVIGQE